MRRSPRCSTRSASTARILTTEVTAREAVPDRDAPRASSSSRARRVRPARRERKGNAYSRPHHRPGARFPRGTPSRLPPSRRLRAEGHPQGHQVAQLTDEPAIFFPRRRSRTTTSCRQRGLRKKALNGSQGYTRARPRSGPSGRQTRSLRHDGRRGGAADATGSGPADENLVARGGGTRRTGVRCRPLGGSRAIRAPTGAGNAEAYDSGVGLKCTGKGEKEYTAGD
jgi:hypothetical protein